MKNVHKELGYALSIAYASSILAVLIAFISWSNHALSIYFSKASINLLSTSSMSTGLSPFSSFLSNLDIAALSFFFSVSSKLVSLGLLPPKRAFSPSEPLNYRRLPASASSTSSSSPSSASPRPPYLSLCLAFAFLLILLAELFNFAHPYLVTAPEHHLSLSRDQLSKLHTDVSFAIGDVHGPGRAVMMSMQWLNKAGGYV